MNRLEIYINDELTDVDESSVDLSVDYSIADINNIDTRKSSLTKTLTFAGTKNNLKIFGFPHEPNVIDEIDQNERPTVKIIFNGSTILDGVFKITDVIRNYSDKVTAIKGVALGDNGDWTAGLNGKKLSNIDLSEYDHIYNETNINLSENIAGDVGTLEDAVVVYPIINYGLIGQTNDGVLVTERKPAIQIYHLVSKIFNDIGYFIDSSFINSSFFQSLYLPFTNEKFQQSQDFTKSKGFRSTLSTISTYATQTLTPPTGSPITLSYGGIWSASNVKPSSQTLKFNDTTSNTYWDGGNFDESGWRYIFDVPLKTNFKLQVQASTIWLKTRFDISIQKFDPATASFLDIIVQKQCIVKDTDGIKTFTIETGEIEFQAGVQVMAMIKPQYKEIENSYFIPYNIISGDLTIHNGSKFFNEVNNELVEGQTTDLAFNLPDKYQIELIQGIKQLFNLYFYTDSTSKSIIIEPRDEFYKGSTLNWSDKVDVSKEITVQYIGDALNKQITYKYKDDSNDEFVKFLNQKTGTTLAEHNELMTNKFSQDGVMNIENNFFAPTYMDYYFELQGFENTLIPKLWGDKIPELAPQVPEFTTKFEPRILYYNGVQNLPNGENWIWNGTSRTDYPNFYSHDEINLNNNNLYFNTELRSHGLFEKYYLNTQKTLNESKVVSMYLHLTEKDIENLDFRKTIFINIDGDGTYYELQGIKGYTPQKKSTYKVELIKKVNVVQLSTLDTTADIYPPATTSPKKVPPQVGLYTVDNGSIVPVYSYDDSGNLFHVQVG